MLARLIESYIKAINKGVVPTIVNAWLYICKIAKTLHHIIMKNQSQQQNFHVMKMI